MEGPFRTKAIELVDHQDGSIISRTLVERKGGTITAFAFDEGQGLSEHTAPYDALVQVLEGNVSVTVSGSIYDLEEGDLILMPAGEPHSLRAVTPFKMLLTMIKD